MHKQSARQQRRNPNYPQMHDPETGEVDRSTVLTVLRHYKVEVSHDTTTHGCFLLIKGDIVESLSLPAMVGRRMLQFFKRTYDIPIHHFYHPDLLGDDDHGHGPVN